VADGFDFVVVGGGSAGCALAGRLSEDPKTSVALIEAGGRDDNWVVTTPGALALMVPSKLNNWAFDTVPQAGLNGRIGYQPRGKGLGGSSSINAVVYIRGHNSDYDHWAALGNTGWSFADVLPIFKRSEDNADFDGEYHGKGGPLPVNKLRTDNPMQQTFLQAAREAQFRIREDFNAEDYEGLGLYQVTQKNGDAGARRAPTSIRSRRPAPICGSRSMPGPPASCSKASARSASRSTRAMKPASCARAGK
jgi:choline dehydrogenase-like flavoprotein